MHDPGTRTAQERSDAFFLCDDGNGAAHDSDHTL
jgi:hypothetical protein